MCALAYEIENANRRYSNSTDGGLWCTTATTTTTTQRRKENPATANLAVEMELSLQTRASATAKVGYQEMVMMAVVVMMMVMRKIATVKRVCMWCQTRFTVMIGRGRLGVRP